MKQLTKQILVALLFLSFISSCKEKTKDELIVGTWSMDVDAMNKTIPPGKSDMKDMGSFKVTFYKDLTAVMERTEMGKPEKKSSTYKLVNDGKYLEVLEPERNKPESTEILELNDKVMRLKTNDSMVIVLKKM